MASKLLLLNIRWIIFLLAATHVHFSTLLLPPETPTVDLSHRYTYANRSPTTYHSPDPWRYQFVDRLPHPEEELPVHASVVSPPQGHVHSMSTCVPAMLEDMEHNLPTLLRSMAAQTVPTDEIVIAMSDVGKNTAPLSSDVNNTATTICRDSWTRLRAELDNFNSSIPLRLFCVGERMTAGRSRNLATEVAGGTLLSFVDADDTESEDRNQIVHNMFECYPDLRLLLHSFENGRKPHPYGGLKSQSNYTCADQQEGLEVLRTPQLYDILEKTHRRWYPHQDIVNGHPVIHRRVLDFVKFPTLYKGEDCVFIRDVMFRYGRNNNNDSVVFLNRPLTAYVKHGGRNKDLS